MTAATAPPPDVAAYLAAVREGLSDLPAVERDDLLAEVEASLADAAAEGGAIAARLGPPEEFAAELRSAAGFDAPAASPSRPQMQVPLRLRAFACRLRGHRRLARLERTARELAPIWWVARAYFAVGAFAYLIDAQWSTRYPFVPRLGPSGTNAGATGAIVILLATVASVWIGLVARRRGVLFPRAAAIANALLVLAIVPTVAEIANTSDYDALVANAYAPPTEAASIDGIWNDGVRVDNIYPFSRDGKLLHDVLLYDGAGRPLNIPSNPLDNPERRFVVTNGNQPLFNVFPIRYYDPGTRRVARPNAKPYVQLPLVVTPPLEAARKR